MILVGSSIAILFIILVVILLVKKLNPHAVLLFSGVFMLCIARALHFKMPVLVTSTGLGFFDNFVYIKDSLSEINAGVGLMIMVISGFVAFSDKIGASDALVYCAMKPLSFLKKYPYIIASLIIPIGQLLFVCIPSAAGLGLLLMASIFPIMVNLGVSRLSAVSVITACTAFGMGPASVITARSVKIIEVSAISHFFDAQLPLMLPLSLTLMISYYFVNKHYDKKNKEQDIQIAKTEDLKLKVPLFYAIIPVLPLILLFTFSESFHFFGNSIKLDTTTVMIMCLFIGLLFELGRTRDIRAVFQLLKIFFDGMGNIFKSVVTLIIAAEIFSKGLISLMFIDGLVSSSQILGLGGIGISIVMTLMIFFASILMGSGNAAFFSFGPLVPALSKTLGINATFMILPMEFSASIGRTLSPISGTVLATAEIAKVTPFEIVKRNAIPFGITMIVMIIIHYTNII